MTSQYSAEQYTQALAKKYQQALSDMSSGATGEGHGADWRRGPTQNIPAGIAPTPQGGVGQVIDFLSRPVYGVGRLIDTVNEFSFDKMNPRSEHYDPNATEWDVIGGWFPGAIHGLARGTREVVAPERRMLPSEAIFENVDPENLGEGAARFSIGLGLDIALDPITYLGLGAISRVAGVAKKIPGVTAATSRLAQGTVPLAKQARPAVVPTVGETVGRDFASALEDFAGTSARQLEPGPVGRRTMDEVAAAQRALTEPPPMQIGPARRPASESIAQADEVLAGRAARANEARLASGESLRVGPGGITEVSDNLRFVPPAKGGPSAKMPARMLALQHAITGEIIPYQKRLLNLRYVSNRYPGVKAADIPTPFKQVPVRKPKVVRPAAQAATGKINVAAHLKTRGVPLTKEGKGLNLSEWMQWKSTQKRTSGFIDVGGTPTSVRALAQQIILMSGKDPAGIARAKAALQRAYDTEYIQRIAKIKEGLRSAAKTDISEKGAVAAGAVDEATLAAQAAEVAAKATNATRPVRVRGQALTDVKTKISRIFNEQDAKVILTKKTAADYEVAVKTALASKSTEPTYRLILIEAAAPTPIKDRILDLMAKAPQATKPVRKSRAKKPATASEKKAAEAETLVNKAKEGVKTASEIVDDAIPGSTRTFEYEEIFRRHGIDDDTWRAFVQAVGPEGQQWLGANPNFKFVTEHWKTLRNSNIPGKGNGINRESYNTGAQARLFYNLKIDALEKMPVRLSSPTAKAEWMLSPKGFDLINKMRSIDKLVRASGVEPILTVTKRGWPVSTGDLLHILYHEAGYTGRSFLLRRLMPSQGISPTGFRNVQGRFEVTELANAARTMLDSLSPVWANAADFEMKIQRSIRKMNLGKEDESWRVFVRELYGKQGPTVLKKGKGKLTVTSQEAASVMNEGMAALYNERFLRALFQVAHTNAAHSVLQLTDQVREMSTKSMNHIVSVVNDINASIADAVRATTKIDEVVEAAAGTAKLPVSDDAIRTTVTNVKDTIPELIAKIDIDGTSHLAAVNAAVKNFDPEAVVREGLRHHAKIVEEALSEIPPELIDDMYHAADVAAQAGILSKMMPVRAKAPQGFLERMGWAEERIKSAFLSHYRNPTLSLSIAKSESVMRNMQSAWRQQLNYVHHLVRRGKATEADIGVVWKSLRASKNESVALTPMQEKIRERLLPAFHQIFENGEEAGVLGAFFREGHDIQSLINKMASPRYGLKDNWVFDLKAVTNKQGKIDVEALANQWKKWEINEPLDFMAKMQTLAGSLALDMGTAQEAWRLAKSLGRASRIQRVGFVQMAEQQGSVIGRCLPKGAWFDPEILKEIRRVDWLLSQTDQFDGAFGQFVNRYLDPVMASWKAGVTVWNPGHYVRNGIGDAVLSFLADGVRNPRYYRDAIRILAYRKNYSGWDALRALRGTGRAPVKEGEIIAHLKNGTPITERELFVGLMDRGSLPTAAVSEDLLEILANSSVVNVQRKMALTGGRAKKVVGSVSEGRDDYFRLAHAMHVVEHGNFKTIEEALDAAAKQVRRWHPDGLTLTPFERKVMRRIFPFYSWTRKTAPLIVESMVVNPGRFMVGPKISYNWAEASGIDLQSMSVPFPEDQLFPSYMSESILGPQFRDPQGDYHGISPGLPQVDILDQFLPDFTHAETGSDFIQELFGGPISMLSPLFKLPTEGVTGTSATTGGPIHDFGEYLDSQIPGLNKISSIFGVSPLGSLAQAAPGGAAGVVDYRRSVEKGNREAFSVEAMLNYLLNLGSVDMSTPSTVRQAQIEERNLRGRESRRRHEQQERGG